MVVVVKEARNNLFHLRWSVCVVEHKARGAVNGHSIHNTLQRSDMLRKQPARRVQAKNALNADWIRLFRASFSTITKSLF